MRKVSLLEVPEGAWPWQYVDFRLSAFTAVRQHVVLSHPLYGTLLWESQETNTSISTIKYLVYLALFSYLSPGDP